MEVFKRYLILIFIAFLILSANKASAQYQSITNEGTDFWLAFTECYDLTTATYTLNISSRYATSGNVSIPGTGFSQNFTTVPNVVSKVSLPPNDATIIGSEYIAARGVHVTSTDPIVVYASTAHQYRSEASLVLPTPSLGTEYRAMSYYTENTNGLMQSEFIIVAAGDTVTVEINTTSNTEMGQPAFTPWTITLNPGEVYQVQAQADGDDLTGSIIRSVAPTEDVSFAVYSGHVWAWTFCFGNKDPLYEAVFPTTTWGKEYILLRTPNRAFDEFRALAHYDSTFLSVDNVVVDTLMAGEFYADSFSVATYVTADKRISVAVFTLSGSCDLYMDCDPSMVLYNSNEQMFLDTITFYTTDQYAIDSNYVHIVTRTVDTSTIDFNGVQVSLTENWNVFLWDSAYSYATFLVDTGSHTITTTECGFLAYVVGMSYAESYYYAAGVSLMDLTDTITFSNISTGLPIICVGDSIQFVSSTSGNPLSFSWHFGDGDSSDIPNPVHVYPDSGLFPIMLAIEYVCLIDTIFDTLSVILKPVVDIGLDTLICEVGGQIILDAGNPNMSYIWSTGATTQQITVTQTGTYWVIVDNSVCITGDTIMITIPIPPNPDIASSTNLICQYDDVIFTGTTDQPVLSWSWEFGDGNGSSTQNPSNAYQSGGNYTYQLIIEYDCHTDTLTGTLEVLTMPVVDLGPDTALCLPVPYGLDAGNSGMGYLWSTGEDNRTIEAPKTGTYSVKVNNQFCEGNDEVYVDIPLEAIIPNVISPNGDELNELFEIAGIDRCEIYNMKIFNRWGEIVFETDDPLNEFWDGKNTSGEEVNAGAYYYVLDNEQNPLKGVITVIR